MAMGTILIAFVPGYATIGFAAALLVLIGRLLQGFSAGVELGGVSVFCPTMATPGHKGFYVSWQSGSQQVANVVAALLGFAINKWLMPEQVVAWGWRIPFFIGCLIVPFIFVIRRSLQETEEFLNRKHRPNTSEIFRSIVDNWRIVLAGVLLVIMTTVSFYLVTIYTPSYGKNVLKLAEADGLLVTLCVGVSNFFWLPVMGALSDRVGRRPVLMTFTVLTILTAYRRCHGLSLTHRSTRCCWSSSGSRSLYAELQWCNGGGAHRDCTSERSHRRVLAGIGLSTALGGFTPTSPHSSFC